jgi:hypothetical protein
MSECIIKNSSALPDDVFTDNGVNFGDIQFEDDDDDDENDECVVSVEKLKKQIMGDTESELNFDASKFRDFTFITLDKNTCRAQYLWIMRMEAKLFENNN